MKHKDLTTFLFLTIFLLILTCPAYGANITGTVNFKGNRPKLSPFDTSSDAACPNKVYPEDLSVSTNNELANVLVYVKEGVPRRKFPPPQNPVVLDQVSCRYVPHVFAAMVGQKVIFKTSDPTLHTVDFHGKSARFSVSMPKGHPGGAKIFKREELMVPIKCSAHPWMLAFGNILKHPYFFVSDKKGRYLIKDLPAGAYTLEAWHEKLGRMTKTVTLERNNDFKKVDFTFYRR